MRAIVAVSANWGIGRANDLLFHIPEDLRFFRRMTAGGTMIIGRKNLESFPGGRPLKDRRHLVLTRQEDYICEGAEIFHSPKELIPVICGIPEETLWVCGGGVVYRRFLPFCREALVTEIDETPEADVFFPNLNREGSWERTEAGPWQEYQGKRFRFCTWVNHEPLPLTDLT